MMFDDKVVLVTGASRGIGQAIAKQFAQRGAIVIGTATTEKGADAITGVLAELGNNKSHGFVLDVTNIESVERLMTAITERHGAPSILINNAGITRDNLSLRMDEDEWSSVIEANLTSVFRMSKACVRTMFRARWGRIISIGSVVGSTGNAGQCNYTAAKAGISGFTKSLAQEISSRGVTVNMVSPGFIDTDMTRALPDILKDELLKKIPMKRLGQAEDIADAVIFLASDGANYISGETIHVNGGMYMS